MYMVATSVASLIVHRSSFTTNAGRVISIVKVVSTLNKNVTVLGALNWDTTYSMIEN